MTTEKSYDDIKKEIKDLEKKQKVIVDFVKEHRKNIDDIEKQIKNLTKLYPRYYSCGKHFHPKQMIIAMQEDIDEYVDQNEGYCGPEFGEYYCGC